MKLLASPTSPFVRKVIVCARRVGLAERVDVVRMSTSDPALLGYNPLGKIPVLLTNTGEALLDSRVACEYLDGLHDGEKLFPGDARARFVALTRQALADGMIDALAVMHAERQRPPEAQIQAVFDKQLGRILRTLNQLDRQSIDFADVVDIGTIAVACSLGYLDQRLPGFGQSWRPANMRLAAWFERFSRQAFMDT